VDTNRIGVIGHSLGGHNSIFTAFFDKRLKAVVSPVESNAATSGLSSVLQMQPP